MVLLFVAFQLWGTNLEASAAQDDLSSDFTQLLSTVPLADPVEPPAEQDAGDPAEPTPTPTPYTLDFIESLYPAEGNPIARITIPKIDVDHTVVEGVDVEDLRKGPGHYMTTPLPGQKGNAAIAGHRTTYGAPFHRVDELVPGDEITTQTLQGTFTYRVIDQDGDGNGNTIVDPSATEVLNDYGDNRLTLTACHPKYSAAQRIIIFAEMVGDPVDTPPRPGDFVESDGTLASESAPAQSDGASDAAVADGTDQSVDGTDGGDGADPVTSGFVEGESAADVGVDAGNDDFGQGLDGDVTSRVPALMWAAAAAVIWMTAVFVGRRTKWVPAFVLALLPFAATLWISFGYIDRALPSY